MARNAKVKNVKGIPMRDEKLGDVVARHVREKVWTIIYHSMFNQIRFAEAMAQVREYILKKFPDVETFRRGYFIGQCLALGSNITLFERGGELWITYTHLVKIKDQYSELFHVMPGRGYARLMRITAEEVLKRAKLLEVASIKAYYKYVYNTSAWNTKSLYVRNAEFVLMPLPDGIYVATYNRVVIEHTGIR